MRFPDFFRTKEENFAFGGGLTPPKNKNFSFSLERIWASAPLRSENYWVFVGRFLRLDTTKKYAYLVLVGTFAVFCSYERGKSWIVSVIDTTKTIH